MDDNVKLNRKKFDEFIHKSIMELVNKTKLIEKEIEGLRWQLLMMIENNKKEEE
jgi:hypothetical protein